MTRINLRPKYNQQESLGKLLGYDHENYKFPKAACGHLAVEATLVADHLLSIKTGNESHSPEAKSKLAGRDRPVDSDICGAMLLGHMVDSLEAKGFTPEVISNASSTDIIKTIDRGCPALLFIPSGLGHWVTIWGYDNHDYRVLDNKEYEERRPDGLVSIGRPNLEYLWRKQNLFYKTLGRLGGWFEVPPCTMVVPWLDDEDGQA